MSSAHKNLSEFSTADLPAIHDKVFAIVVAEWNTEVTGALYAGAVNTLLANGVVSENILTVSVPGSFELSLGAQKMAQKEQVDAVICLGCVIQGETICQAVADGITNVSLKYDKPVIFGVLTPNNQAQAMDRAGGKHGNKGDEAAITAIKMLAIK